jgi:hypothetical protein
MLSDLNEKHEVVYVVQKSTDPLVVAQYVKLCEDFNTALWYILTERLGHNSRASANFGRGFTPSRSTYFAGRLSLAQKRFGRTCGAGVEESTMDSTNDVWTRRLDSLDPPLTSARSFVSYRNASGIISPACSSNDSIRS